jgi:hypothetical protein
MKIGSLKIYIFGEGAEIYIRTSIFLDHFWIFLIGNRQVMDLRNLEISENWCHEI